MWPIHLHCFRRIKERNFLEDRTNQNNWESRQSHKQQKTDFLRAWSHLKVIWQHVKAIYIEDGPTLYIIPHLKVNLWNLELMMVPTLSMTVVSSKQWFISQAYSLPSPAFLHFILESLKGLLVNCNFINTQHCLDIKSSWDPDMLLSFSKCKMHICHVLGHSCLTVVRSHVCIS